MHKNNNLPTIDNKEFKEELPFINGVLEPITESKTNRRDFLKMLGFSVSAASLAAGCSIPERKSIPYINRPEDITPGMASYYSTIFSEGGDYVPIKVKNRDGRPIKVEGNDKSILSNGGTTALAQASVVSLYDSKRYQKPQINKIDVDWNRFNLEVISKLTELNSQGKKVALITNSINSPSTNNLIFEFTTKFQNIYQVVVDPISYSGLIDATEEAFGTKTLPEYKFDSADMILSIGADFLGTWISPVEYSKDYITRRKVSKDNLNMSKHIQVESVPSPTSSSSDTKVLVTAAEESRFVADLYNSVTTGSASDIKGVSEVAKQLLEAKNSGKKILVVNGSNDKNIQLITYALNNFLGAIGTTVFVSRKINYKKGNFKDISTLASDLSNNTLSGAIFLNSNAVYDLAYIKDIDKKIKALDFTLSFGERINETTTISKYIAATNHYLESWNDHEPKDGVYSIAQPLITRLFDTKQFQECLMNWSGNTETYYNYIKNNSKVFFSMSNKYKSFDDFWLYTLQNGESAKDDMTLSSVSFGGVDVNSLISKVTSDYPKSKLDVKLYNSVHGDGSFADNPFIQELPDPISRMTWDNYILANPKWVDENGLNPVLNEKKYRKANVTINGVEVSLPVVPMAGVAYGTLGIKFGFGRTTTSNTEYQSGFNAYRLVKLLADNLVYTITDVKFNKSEDLQDLSSVQSYFTLDHKGLGGEKTRLLVKETTLKEYTKNPEAGNTILGEGRKKWIDKHLKTLYPGHEYNSHKWGMVIDLNSCVGCGACVVACNIENNVPVVGRKEVYRSHDMHWLRIDRYETGDTDNPDVTFQPMLCQHCDNAPCENVCPVSATNHSSEGLNQMAYNRCIGTRYCANNCPYKVRRFNWFDYTGSDSFGAANDNDPLNRLDPIARMVINPDVVTRSRGVIEKCSFCVQKIQEGKLEAKKEGRELLDGDVKSACQLACSTSAISFGDVNNNTTEVGKLVSDERAFGVIEEIFTAPAVNYLTKVKNK